MAEQAENLQFLHERAAQQQKERIRKATTSAFFVLGMVGLLALFALSHPLLAGGGLAEAGQHAQLMISSSSFSGLVEACASVAPGAPAGNLDAMATMAA